MKHLKSQIHSRIVVAKNCGEGEWGTMVYDVPAIDDKKVLERGGGDGCTSVNT